MAGDEPSPVHLRTNHLHGSMQERVRNITVGLVSLEDEPSVSYCRSTAIPCSGLTGLWGPLAAGSRLSVFVVLDFDISFPDFCTNFANS